MDRIHRLCSLGPHCKLHIGPAVSTIHCFKQCDCAPLPGSLFFPEILLFSVNVRVSFSLHGQHSSFKFIREPFLQYTYRVRYQVWFAMRREIIFNFFILFYWFSVCSHSAFMNPESHPSSDRASFAFSLTFLTRLRSLCTLSFSSTPRSGFDIFIPIRRKITVQLPCMVSKLCLGSNMPCPSIFTNIGSFPFVMYLKIHTISFGMIHVFIAKTGLRTHPAILFVGFSAQS